LLDDEQTVKWLILLGVAAAVVLYVAAGKRGDRKRREWFDSVAAAFGARAEHESEFLSRFGAEVDGRRCEVVYRYRTRIGWRLVASIPLTGVSAIYSFSMQPSDDPADSGVRVRNHGFSPREGWLNDEVRPALSHFYELTPHKEALEVEASALTCQTYDRLEGAALRARVSRLVPVATALERTL
jgi:hypothetical protein